MNNKKLSILTLCLLMTFLISVGGTVAYLATKGHIVKNTFTPVSVECEIREEFDSKIKKNVKVQNTGDVDAYIRVKVVVNWKNGSDLIPAKPSDYTIDYTDDELNSNWIKKNGFYYYKLPVAVGGYTDVLISSAKQQVKAPAEGYQLHIEIMTQAIQANGGRLDGVKAIEDAWGIDISMI